MIAPYQINPLPIKMMEGCICLAAVNKALTNFSPSPTYLDVNVDALTNRNICILVRDLKG